MRQGAAGIAVSPFIPPSRIWGAEKGPNSLVNMALIGIGMQNRGRLDNFLWRDINVLAVCDVDKNRPENALRMVEKFHADHQENRKTMKMKAFHETSPNYSK